MKSNKKSQVTAFIILGLLLVVLIMLLYAFRYSLGLAKPPLEYPEVSLEAKPIQNFVEGCIYEVSKRGLVRLGNNGGFIGFPSGTTIHPLNYESDVLSYPPNSIAYWHYLTDCEHSVVGCFSSMRPPLCPSGEVCVLQEASGQNSVSEQLAEYLNTHLKDCTNGFEQFGEQFAIEEGPVDAKVFVADDDVKVQVDYPLEITSKFTELQETVSKFRKDIDVRFKDIYETAQYVAWLEQNVTFLEHMMLNLITAYSGVDQERLPPMAGMEFFIAEKKFWIRTEVEERIKHEVLPYMNFIQIVGANNYKDIVAMTDPEHPTEYDKYAHGFMQSFIVNPEKPLTSELDIRFLYPYQDIYLSIGGSELIEPYQMKGDGILQKFVSFFLNDYRFKYDMSFPMIVKLTEPEAFAGQGYEFFIALEANIRNSVPVSEDMVVIDTRRSISTSPLSRASRVPRNITIVTKDKLTNEPLEDVQIFYQCGREYPIGMTKKQGNRAVLVEQFPHCHLGGQIVYKKTGYLGSAVAYDNTEGHDSKQFEFKLWPLRKRNVTIYKRTADNLRAIENFGPGAFEIYDEQKTEIDELDRVIFNIERIKEDPNEDDIPPVGVLNYVGSSTRSVDIFEQRRIELFQLNEQGIISDDEYEQYLAELEQLPPESLTIENPSAYTIELAPGEYHIEAFLLYEGGIALPRKVESVCKLGVEPLCLEYQEIEFPELNISSWLNGGAVFTTTFNPTEVYNDDELVFYVLEMPLVTSWDDMLSYKSIEEFQEGREGLLIPGRE